MKILHTSDLHLGKNLSDESYYDVMFYFSVLKKYLNDITELPRVIINTIYNLKVFRNKIAIVRQFDIGTGGKFGFAHS